MGSDSNSQPYNSGRSANWSPTPVIYELGDRKPTFDGENMAYQVGFGVGSSKAKGDWEAKAFWQSVDAFALDTNIVDSDLFDSRTNMEGFVLQGSYVISNGVTVKFTYANADRKNDSLATYGKGDIDAANLTHYQLFQADLSVKF